MFDERDHKRVLEMVDWRWQIASIMATEGKKPLQFRDKWIWNAWNYLLELRASISEADRIGIGYRYPETDEAFDLWHRPAGIRHLIEALVLCSDMDQQSIADYLVRPIRTVQMYEKLFFDVRQNLGKSGYLCTKILQPALLEEIHNLVSPVFAWKLIAVFGGFKAVKACWECPRIQEDEPVGEFYRRVGLQAMERNFGLGNMFRPVNTFTIAEIDDSLTKFMTMEIQKQMGQGATQLMKSHTDLIGQVLSSLKFCIVDQDKPLETGRVPRLHEKISRQIDAELASPN